MTRRKSKGSAEAAPAAKERQFVTALARGLEVLRAFRPGEAALGNQELAARTGLSKSTVSRLTHTLLELGYLTYSERSGRYRLGPGVLSLGYAMIAGLEVRQRARPLLADLAAAANVTVALGARDRLSAVYLECCRGEEAVTLSLQVGSRVPLGTTAMGRALLAALPEGERDYLLRALRDRRPEDFPQVAQGVEAAVRDIEAQGFCTSFGDWCGDVNAVGVPLFSLDGEHLYALNCGGPSFSVSPAQLLEDLGPRLVQIARTLSVPHKAVSLAANRG